MSSSGCAFAAAVRDGFLAIGGFHAWWDALVCYGTSRYPARAHGAAPLHRHEINLLGLAIMMSKGNARQVARRGTLFILTAALLALGVGCASVRVTDPPRTATEQLLLSTAVGDSIAQFDFSPFDGHEVYLDTQYLESIDQAFVVGDFRAALMAAGASLTTDSQTARFVCEPRAGGVGIDKKEYFIGIPGLPLPRPPGVDLPATATPELALFKLHTQIGIASLAYTAYDARTKRRVASGGPFVGLMTSRGWWFFTFGPFGGGDLKIARTTPRAPS